jgi:putative ABC transport system permease protein
MLWLDKWQEIFGNLQRHKLRTALTGIAVGWGIFMLILLLGAGKGLSNKVEEKFADDAINSIWIHRGQTALPYRGLRPGRQIQFGLSDIKAVQEVPGVEHITGRFYMREAFTVSYGSKNSSFDVRAVHPGHQYIEKTIILQGRYLNDIDIEERRKTAVIGIAVKKFFFPNENPVGKYITIRGTQYRVVGVFEDEGDDGELQKIFIPITTAQRAYGAGDQIHAIMFTVGEAGVDQARRISEQVKQVLSRRHRVDPEDRRAFRIRNNVEEFHKITQLFELINLIIWIVGAGTILAGVVGVSNILLISVAERTVEFGVRKALGATPLSIVVMVLKESLLVTAVAGYAGLVAGVGLLELASHYLPDNDYIKNPEVDIRIALIALITLVVAGALAGYFPARRAARIDPVAALRDE